VTRILVVEDEPGIAFGLELDLETEGYGVEIVPDGNAAVERGGNGDFDLILLDLMLPGKDGFEVCRELRRSGCKTPIIMLSAKTHETEKVMGLDLGADDYVTKPFSIKELLARAAAFLRRAKKEEQAVYEFGALRLDVSARRLLRKNKEIDLSPKEFNLLEYFVKKPGRALTRDEILNAVWSYDCVVTSRSIDRFVTTLRNKIEPDPARPIYIHTIRQIGYRFDPPEHKT